MVKHRRRNRLDKRDELWCYILIKFINSVLADPSELERLKKQKEIEERISKTDLESVVAELKKHLKDAGSPARSMQRIEKASSGASTSTSTFTCEHHSGHAVARDDEPPSPLLETLMEGFREIYREGRMTF